MKLYHPDERLVAKSRPVWSECFSDMAEKHDNVIAINADLSRSTTTEVFRKKVPERYFNVGIAEQNMMGMAAGLALSGKIPYVTTFAPFAALRAGEQFRNDVCYMNLNVRVVAPYGGIAQPAGPTHSGLEDMGTIRGMPNSSVVSPSDLTMVAKVFEASVDYEGPLYIRLGIGANEPYIYAEDFDFEIGKAIIAREGKDATIISTGMMLSHALKAALELESQGIRCGIIDMHTVKPLDTAAVIAAARATGCIVTMEQHSIFNGLGSAVAEVILESGVPCRFKRIGIPDIFPSYGDPDRLAAKYGFDAAAAAAAVKDLLKYE